VLRNSRIDVGRLPAIKMKPRRIPVESFCRNPDMSGVSLSPDGRVISFLRPWRDRKNIFIQIGANGQAQRVTAEERRDVTSYFWKGDRYLIYQTDSGYSRFDITSGEVGKVLLGKAENANLLDRLDGISADEILLVVFRADQNLSDVYRVNILSGEPRMVAEHPDPGKFGTVQYWVRNNCGDVCAAISVQRLNDLLLTRPDPQSPFKIARRMDFRRSIEPQFYPYLFYTANNDAIYAISRTRRGRDKAAVVILSAKTGRELRCLYQNRHVDVASFAFSNQRKVITYVSFHNSKPRNKVLDRRTAPIFKTLARLPHDYAVQLTGHDAAEKKFIVFASTDRIPGKYYLLDTSHPHRHSLTPLGEMAPWLSSKQLAPVSPIQFKARDGLTIHGYLTLPIGQRAKKKLPAVVDVHGGPENRNYWYYDPLYSGEIQFLVNRGYAVLQINFRGSIGYGRSFWIKGFGQRGRKMQDDVTDAVQWLMTRKIADPKRIAIYGKSYGGYAALVGVTFPPDLYRAAIDFAGVSNWLTWLRDFPPGDPLYPQYCVKVGDPEKNKKQLEEVAPVLHADKIEKPVFIAHGALDGDVLKTESDQMVAALRDLEYVVKPAETHIWLKEENKIDFCLGIERFLAKHLY
jgi:dienelactone hydrolase